LLAEGVLLDIDGMIDVFDFDLGKLAEDRQKFSLPLSHDALP
jgi:hypothetical protein